VRGNPKLQNPMFFGANTEERLAKNHPLRAIKRRADEVLKQMERAFDTAYSETGRPGIPPEALLKALLLQALYSIPSERRLNVFAILRALFSQAVEDGAATVNPASRLGKFNKADKEGRKVEFLTEAEADSFLSTVRKMRPDRYPFFLCALRTGMRLGELLALEWEDVQFGQGDQD
jgi:integrase